MIVYGTSVSPFVRKTLAFIREKGLTADHRPLPPQATDAEFRACSPLGKIPGFRDGDYRLADSSAICHYLERKYPSPPLFPRSAEDVGRMIWFEEFSDTVLFAAIGKVFFQLFVRPQLHRQEPDMAIVESALKSDVPAALDYLQTQISGPFLVGDTITLADIAIACPFINLKLCKRPLDAERWPKLAEYLTGIHTRPTFAGIRDPKAA